MFYISKDYHLIDAEKDYSNTSFYAISFVVLAIVVCIRKIYYKYFRTFADFESICRVPKQV